ncbi:MULTISPECIES: ATP-binding protein DrrA1-3 family domain-containing protein [Carnobacterium]|uniref:DUF4162 domain-containing protein n=1 Tax=Carnobacterium antarcticum TaxID=2126436 RepID=A0ABW4NPW2_9LACT
MKDEDLLALPGVTHLKKTKDGLTVLDLSDAEYGKEIFEVVTKEGYISTFSQQPPTLEEIFRLKAGAPHE